MTQVSTYLNDFKRNVDSQTGEDGILGKVLSMLPERNAWCVEFGAWDGRHLSNTSHLIREAGYSAVLIEGSSRRYEDLKRTHAGNPRVITLNAMVGYSAGDSLDELLAKTEIPENFDLLSIDIDGNDYHVWKAVSRYRPKVVCIEFNPTIPTEVRFVQAADPSEAVGASLLSLVELGKSKGYELVATTLLNAIFVRSEYFPLFEIADNRPQTLRTDLSLVTHMFMGYDGTVRLEGNRMLPWHPGVRFLPRRVQQLPWILRRFPDNGGGLFYKMALRCYAALTDPAWFWQRKRKRTRRGE